MIQPLGPVCHFDCHLISDGKAYEVKVTERDGHSVLLPKDFTTAVKVFTLERKARMLARREVYIRIPALQNAFGKVFFKDKC